MKKIKSNNGFTLIELVIALAMLAFIMTAVSALMGSSVLNFRKDKANISIQNSAQSTYDKLSDVIMQAKKITIYGYIGPEIDFDGIDDEADVTGTYDDFYFVSDADSKKTYEDAGKTNVKLFEEVDPAQKIYVTSIIIDIAVPIESISDVTGSYDEHTTEFDVLDAINGGTVHVTRMSADGETPVIYDTTDTLRCTFEFNGKNMYYGRKYAFQAGKNDELTIQDDEHLFTNVFKSVNSDAGPISGCVVTVDSTNGAIGLELHFFDKSMKYNTLGMVKIRNSKVLENN